MKALIAALLMMGPFATEIDIVQAGKVYARALHDCGVWVAGDVRGKLGQDAWLHEDIKMRPTDGNIANMIIGDHDAAICIDDGASNIVVKGNMFRGRK